MQDDKTVGSSCDFDERAEVRASTTSTYVVASTQIALTSNLRKHTIITLGNDIILKCSNHIIQTGVIINENQIGLSIEGLGLYKVDGQNAVRCFYIGGSGVNVIIQTLEISHGHGNGGCLYIYEATVNLMACTISMSDAIRRTGPHIRGCLYISSASVSFMSCSILNHGLRQDRSIALDSGFFLLAGTLFSSDSKSNRGSDLYISTDSNVTFLGSRSSNASKRTNECSSCGTTYPADLLSGECVPFPTLDPSSSHGNIDDEACTDASISASFKCELPRSSVVSQPTIHELQLMRALPTSQPAPAIEPTSLQAAETLPPIFLAAFTANAVAILASIVIMASWYLRQKSSSNYTEHSRDDALHDDDDYDSAQESIESKSISSLESVSKSPASESFRSYEDGFVSFASSSSEATRESHEIASTYGAEHTFLGSSEHGDGGLYRGKPPFDVLVSHLHRHGLENDIATSVAGYLSRTFGVRSVGDFRLLEEADVVKTAEDVGLLKIPASRLRIAWR